MRSILQLDTAIQAAVNVGMPLRATRRREYLQAHKVQTPDGQAKSRGNGGQTCLDLQDHQRKEPQSDSAHMQGGPSHAPIRPTVRLQGDQKGQERSPI